MQMQTQTQTRTSQKTTPEAREDVGRGERGKRRAGGKAKLESAFLIAQLFVYSSQESHASPGELLEEAEKNKMMHPGLASMEKRQKMTR